MPQLELSIPDDVDMQIERLVDQGDFATRREAIEELLSIGVDTYQTDSDAEAQDETRFAEEMIETSEREMDDDDGYAF